MKKLVLFLTTMVALTAMAQEVQLRFTAADANGNYHPFQTVRIADLFNSWEHTLTYPDTVLTIEAGSITEGIADVEGIAAGLTPNFPNPFQGQTESMLRLDQAGQVTMRLVRVNGAVEYEESLFMEAGEYRLAIEVPTTGMSYLQVETPSRNYVTKMVNTQSGGKANINVARTGEMRNSSARKDTKSFSLGDMMQFSATDSRNGTLVKSNSVLRTQLTGETITLVFNTSATTDCAPKAFSTNQRVFLPDGPYCGILAVNATLEVTGFPEGMTIQSADEIASLCLNYEHSFLGDHTIELICPNGQTSILKSIHEGGGILIGYPYGGYDHTEFDALSTSGSNNICDPLANMYGVGLDYCFSRHADYLLVDGQPANTNTTGEHYFSSDAYTDEVTFTFEDIEEPFYGNGSTAGTKTFETKHPSNKEQKTDYYRPEQDFQGLEGCPLNGTWTIKIEDNWAIDNGWFFGWSIELAPNCGK